ncbi:uncharacterized protein LAESUDRAFT_757973 [Laetiporus sulphureus 93-53]|uniref:Uncharacterized protein n=1 Tax=Laetiporus sulphureus 93-53 TaxID=1314785 RepID=A0A165EV56_9APHY|nr:uncharacterized protein LAESUDRAFT_757973 [Laetiporus sulphureus 93-53]KZT07826.1 hypothetical protein LAESUDRAFT_757973 [Laetiporus sulphureus 93-53]
MNRENFASVTDAYGLDELDYNEYLDNPDVGLSYSASAGAGLEDIDILMEEIEEALSSPFSPEGVRSRNAQYTIPRFTRNPGPQTLLDYDDISEYDDVELYQAFEPQFQPDVHFTGSSSYGPPTLSQCPFATHSDKSVPA